MTEDIRLHFIIVSFINNLFKLVQRSIKTQTCFHTNTHLIKIQANNNVVELTANQDAVFSLSSSQNIPEQRNELDLLLKA